MLNPNGWTKKDLCKLLATRNEADVAGEITGVVDSSVCADRGYNYDSDDGGGPLIGFGIVSGEGRWSEQMHRSGHRLHVDNTCDYGSNKLSSKEEEQEQTTHMLEGNDDSDDGEIIGGSQRASSGTKKSGEEEANSDSDSDNKDHEFRQQQKRKLSNNLGKNKNKEC